MKREEAKAKFIRGAEEMFEEMWAWGEEHPQATFDDITEKMAQARRELMGEMLGDFVLQHGDGRYEEANCSQCGQEMKSNGRRTRTVIDAEGEVKVKRAYRRCPDCGQGIFPPGPTTSADEAA